MIENIITFMQSIISQYGAWGVFLATLIEEIIAPVPSAIVPLAGGFFLLPADISLFETLITGAFVIALPISIGICMGSSVVYVLGFFGGKPLIEKTKKWTGIDWDEVEKINARFEKSKSDEITLFTLRMIPIIPGVAISGVCGLIHYSFKKFLVITALGSFLRALILGMIGWQVGTLYITYADMISRFEKHILFGVLIIAILSIGYYYINKRNKSKTEQE